MIFKAIGRRLFKAKLFIPLNFLALLLIIISPFSLLALPLQSQTLSFQEPTLRPKLFQTITSKPNIQFKQRIGYIYTVIKGRSSSQGMILTYNYNSTTLNRIAQQVAASYQNLYSSGPSKTLLIVGLQNLSAFLEDYYGESFFDQNLHQGIFRIGLHLQSQTETEIRQIFYNPFNKGLSPDTDYYFGLKSILNQLKLIHKLCRNSQFIKNLVHPFHRLLTTFSPNIKKLDVLRFLQSLQCSYLGYSTTAAQLMRHGIMTGTLTLSSDQSNKNNSIIQKNQISKAILSFYGTFAFAEDNLHSSWNLAFPVGEKAITVDKLLIPFILFLSGSAFRLLCQFINKGQRISHLPIGVLPVLAGAGYMIGGVASSIAGGLSFFIIYLQQKSQKSVQSVQLSIKIGRVALIVTTLAVALQNLAQGTILLFVCLFNQIRLGALLWSALSLIICYWLGRVQGIWLSSAIFLSNVQLMKLRRDGKHSN